MENSGETSPLTDPQKNSRWAEMHFDESNFCRIFCREVVPEFNLKQLDATVEGLPDAAQHKRRGAKATPL
jgi:hypothetical protein